MDDLVQFLRARLDEDEQIARIGDADEPPLAWRQIGGTGVIVASDGKRAEECANGNWAGIAERIVRHDPARVLAEVDAKRQIVELHGIVHREIGWLADGEEKHGEIPVCGLCVPKHAHYQRRDDVPEGACRTLRPLALPYADHPDYREEWRPSDG
ncbi:DUF6221 family protein [Streptomyces sp. NBC_01233]|uniref:DUF6221 family protein n=1 Tax=Streptomyces sp. NBC_01233 TaxID=2903787 RepID=UPI002E141144|nr:DUF6221 family protein [Streptomyces sp. NBC_01233]